MHFIGNQHILKDNMMHQMQYKQMQAIYGPNQRTSHIKEGLLLLLIKKKTSLHSLECVKEAPTHTL